MTIPFVRGSDTSEAAAASKEDTSRTDEECVLAYIRSRGPRGATDDEIELMLGMRHQNASARRRSLVLLGFVRDSGMRRMTRSSRLAAVWIATVTVEPLVVPKTPTKAQLAEAVKTMRTAWDRGVPFPAGALATMRWLARRAGLPPP